MYEHSESVSLIINEFEKSLNNPQFYIPKVQKFFNEFMNQDAFCTKSLEEITANEVKRFLVGGNEVENNAENYYFALKSFFEFTYKKGLSGDVMNKVEKPVSKVWNPKYLTRSQIHDVISYLENQEAKIEDRLLIGLFLYTGLSRRHIAELKFGSIDINSYLLQINSKSPQIPIPLFLVKLIQEYKSSLGHSERGPQIRLINIDGNGISDKVKRILRKVLGINVTPTILSNTFIRSCLESTENDVMLVSKFLLENPLTIAKHIGDLSEENHFKRQQYMVSKLYT